MLGTRASHTVIPVNLRAFEQFRAAFLAISPEHGIPAIVYRRACRWREPLFPLFGTTLARVLDLPKSPKDGPFLPKDMPERSHVVAWWCGRWGGLGPMLGQHAISHSYAYGKIPIDRTLNRDEEARLYRAWRCGDTQLRQTAPTSPAITS